MTAPTFSSAPFRARRTRLLAQLDGGVAILPTAPERTRNADALYPYRFDSSFYYLTGFTEPEAVLVLQAATAEMPAKHILFCREKNEEREIWDGFRFGPLAAAEQFGFDLAYPISELTQRLPGLIANRPALFAALGADAAWDAQLIAALSTVREQSRQGNVPPAALCDIRKRVDEMRLFKDPAEIHLMQSSADIASAAHARAMRFAAPGKFEYQVEAEILHTFYQHGAQAPAYTSIVAGGDNACVLHYVSNRAALKDGDLLLIDAGCELDGYASDITRTFPVNGRFSGAQKAVYEIVLAAQLAAIDCLRPGVTFNDPHEVVLRTLTQGLIDLKLLEGSVEDNLESGTYRRFYMHRTSHWLGLDVHDAGEYKKGAGSDSPWRTLENGMVLTIEPGLYIRAGEGVPDALAGIGIRIEDDVLITETGHHVLSHKAPKSISDIEEACQEGFCG